MLTYYRKATNKHKKTFLCKICAKRNPGRKKYLSGFRGHKTKTTHYIYNNETNRKKQVMLQKSNEKMKILAVYKNAITYKYLLLLYRQFTRRCN